MRNISLGVLLAAVTAAPVAAQESARNPQVAAAMTRYVSGRYNPPECDALDETKHFKVSSGRTYLKTSIEGSIAEQRDRQLRDAHRVITEAIVENDQGESPSAWYFLGRVYLHQGDLAGADTALTRAETLAPDCAEEIGTLRRVAFVALVNPGIDSMKAGNNDAALALFREAAEVYPAAPEPVFYQATLLYNIGQIDSALPLFARTLELAGDDTSKAEIAGQARFNYGYALLQRNRAPEAVPVLEAYVQAHPEDVDGKKLLVNAYRATNQAEKAGPLEQELLATAAVDSGAVSGGDLFAIGVTRFQAKQYAEAAEAFETVLSTEPYNRDALFNLANAYLALDSAGKLVETASRLAALDPMNERALQLLGEGYRMSKKQDSLIKVVERLTPMPFSVENTTLQTTADGATLTAVAEGRAATTLSGAAVKPAPVTLVFEFLNAEGQPVATQEVPVPELAADASHNISVQATGPGIVAWRYTRK